MGLHNQYFPSTLFFLLAAFCYFRGSESFYFGFYMKNSFVIAFKIILKVKGADIFKQ